MGKNDSYAFPMAVFAYFPVMSITGMSDGYVVGFTALPAGVAFALLSLLFSRVGVRRYHSTGS